LCCTTTGHGFSYSEFSDALQARFTTAGDIPHYLYLAEHGFQSSGEKADLMVFYPLYPAVIWLVKLFCGSCVTAGLLISWAYWGSACVSMLELCLAEVRPLARRVGRSVAGALPILVLLDGCVYREPVSVTGRPMPLAHRENAVDRRGALGCPAALCRTQDILLILPAVCTWLLAREEKDQRYKGLFLLLIPGEFCGYLLLNKLATGSWMAYCGHQSAAPWSQSTNGSSST
jgi:hypothetical protein